MKNLLLASTVAIAALSTGFAASAQGLSENIRSQIMQFVPDANLTGLTTVQEAELTAIFSNSDNLGAGANPSGAIMAVLDGSSARAVSQFQLSDEQKTEIRLVLPEVSEASMMNLSTAQMAELTGLFSAENKMTSDASTALQLQSILMGNEVATVGQTSLTEAEIFTIRQYVPEANVDVLTTAQYAELTTLLGKSDNLRSSNDPAGKIRTILGM